jgi:hypothetical protein
LVEFTYKNIEKKFQTNTDCDFHFEFKYALLLTMGLYLK